MSVLKVASLTPLAKALQTELERQLEISKTPAWVGSTDAHGNVLLEGTFNLYGLAGAIVAFQENTTKQGENE